jgi:tellurite resistance protein
MTTDDPNANRLPPPEFPPRRAGLFARTPPAVFPPVLGFLGLAIALRLALVTLAQPVAAADFVAGVAVALWAFAAFAYAMKIVRRPGVVVEDLRVLPGRAGLAAMTMGGMATAALAAPFAPLPAAVLLVAALAGHAVLALLLIRLLRSLPPAAREVNPTWHLSFVGFIVAAPGAVALDWTGLAEVLFWSTLPVAAAIWGLSVMQCLRVLPPGALRPLLAIHVGPASLLSTVACQLGKADTAEVFLIIALLCAGLLVVTVHWVMEAGITPMWGAFTFPLAALASAMLINGEVWHLPGLAVVVLAIVANPLILSWVLKRWPSGRLAAVTNAAEA